MKKVSVIGKPYVKNLEGKLVWCSDVESCNEPLLASSQYGWRTGCKDEDFYVIYPPFNLVSRKTGDVETLGSASIECDKAVSLYDYLKDGNTIPFMSNRDIIVAIKTDNFEKGSEVEIDTFKEEIHYKGNKIGFDKGLEFLLKYQEEN